MKFSRNISHIVFNNNGKEKTTIDELQPVKVYLSEYNQDYYFMDIEIELNFAAKSPV